MASRFLAESRFDVFSVIELYLLAEQKFTYEVRQKG